MIALYFDCIFDLVLNVLGYNLPYHMLLVLSNFDALRKCKKINFLKHKNFGLSKGWLLLVQFWCFYGGITNAKV
jgi:hypothetical protein